MILTPGFAASEADSTCLPLQQALVQTWIEHYPQLRVVILSFQYPYAVSTYGWHAATVHSFNGRNKGGLSRLLIRRRVFKTLHRLHQHERIIGLLSFWYNECAAVGQLFGKRHCLRHCCWLLGQDAKKGNRYPLSHPLEGGELLALSDFLQEEFEQNYGVRPQHVVPPGVRKGTLSMLKGERDIDLLAAGSLIPLKAYDRLVEIVAAIKKVLPSVRVVLIGDGPEKERLQKLITRQGLEKNIALVGGLPHTEVLRYMQRARLFLHPSAFEGFGVVCLEALAAGAQVVSFVRPMKQPVKGWHIVSSEKEMAEKAVALLQIGTCLFEPQRPFPLEETARQILQVFLTEKG